MSDISDEGLYYGGFFLDPSVAKGFTKNRQLTTATDVAHCDCVGTHSYGTTFEVVGYDKNNDLLDLVFGHFVGAEWSETWRSIFTACCNIEGFDIPLRRTIADK